MSSISDYLMARLHSKKRGKSRSHRPVQRGAEQWLDYSPEEVVSFVESLARSGKTEAQIGQTLRDQYGIPSVKGVTGKSLSQLLQEKSLAPKYPSDLIALMRRAVNVRQHISSNPTDRLNRKKLSDVESKIKRLVRYYQGDKLPQGWKYNPETAALIVK